MGLPQRKSPRLAEYDYSANGAYFVTFCTHEKRHILSTISPDGISHFTQIGDIADSWILHIPQKFPACIVDNYVIMPNHIHILLRIDDMLQAQNVPLSSVIGWLKYGIVKESTQRLKKEAPIFQRSFHDHVIRSSEDYETIFSYIACNPQRWAEDRFYSE